MKLHFVTSNEAKMREASEILGMPLEITNLELPEIQSLDLEEIVRAKVHDAYKKVKQPVFVDDVGVYIQAWNGFPGPLIKFLLASGGNDLVVKMLKDEPDRSVIIKSAIGYHDGTKVHIFVGEVKGILVKKPRGKSWGWEPIFQPENHDKTYAQMPQNYKNSISMRYHALQKFKAYLQK